MRKLNLLFLAILLAAMALLGGGMHFVHAFQVRRNATALLDRAERAVVDKDLESAEQSLRQYLSLRREDGPAWKRYAQVVEQRDRDHRRREDIFLVHEQALRYNPDDSQLERRCADLALELRRYGDAQRHLTNVLKGTPEDSQGQRPAAEVAEIEDLLGQCDRGLARYEKAQKWFLESLAHDPGRVSCYHSLARLRRSELRRKESADSTIKEMVKKNPKAGRAYLYRWAYSREFSLPADTGDLQKALELAPDDPEVLFAAAVASEEKKKPRPPARTTRRAANSIPKISPSR